MKKLGGRVLDGIVEMNDPVGGDHIVVLESLHACSRSKEVDALGDGHERMSRKLDQLTITWVIGGLIFLDLRCDECRVCYVSQVTSICRFFRLRNFHNDECGFAKIWTLLNIH